MNDNSQPTSEDIAHATRRLVTSAPVYERLMREHFHMATTEMTMAFNPRVNVPLTIQAIERSRMRRILAILLETTDAGKRV
jgi:hypothetical protein